MGKRRHRTVGHSGITVDTDHVLEAQTLWQGVAEDHVAGSALVQGQAHFILDKVADAHVRVGRVIGIRETGLDDRRVVLGNQCDGRRPGEIIVNGRCAGSVAFISRITGQPGPLHRRTVDQVLVGLHTV